LDINIEVKKDLDNT